MRVEFFSTGVSRKLRVGFLFLTWLALTTALTVLMDAGGSSKFFFRFSVLRLLGGYRRLATAKPKTETKISRPRPQT